MKRICHESQRLDGVYGHRGRTGRCHCQAASGAQGQVVDLQPEINSMKKKMTSITSNILIDVIRFAVAALGEAMMTTTVYRRSRREAISVGDFRQESELANCTDIRELIDAIKKQSVLVFPLFCIRSPGVASLHRNPTPYIQRACCKKNKCNQK